MKHTLLTLTLTLALTITAAAQTKIYVFTKTTEGGFVDNDSKRRADTVIDLRKALEKKKVIIVEAPSDAQITLEVLGSAQEGTGETIGKSVYVPLTGQVLSSSKETTGATLNVALKVGDYTTTLASQNTQVFGAWKAAAGSIANQVEKWVKANAARLSKE